MDEQKPDADQPAPPNCGRQGAFRVGKPDDRVLFSAGRLGRGRPCQRLKPGTGEAGQTPFKKYPAEYPLALPAKQVLYFEW